MIGELTTGVVVELPLVLLGSKRMLYVQYALMLDMVTRLADHVWIEHNRQHLMKELE
jgi:hypothetical protein